MRNKRNSRSVLSLIIIVAVMSLGKPQIASADPTRQDLMARAQSKLKVDDFQAAINCLNRASAGGETVYLLFLRGMAFAKSGNYIAGLKDLTRVIQLAPKNARAYSARAGVYLAMSQAQAAWRDCDQAVALDPDDGTAYDFRATAKGNLGLSEGLEADREQAQRLKASEVNPFENSSLPDVVAALPLKTVAPVVPGTGGRTGAGIGARTASSDPIALRDQAIICERENKFSTAMSYINRAIQLKPSLAELYLERAEILSRMKNPTQALSDIEHAIKLAKVADGDVLFRRARVLIDLNQHARAIADLESAVKLGNANAITLTLLGKEYTTIGQLKIAVADYSKAIAIDPQCVGAYVGRATCYETAKQYKDALTDIGQSVKFSKPDIGLLKIQYRLAKQLHLVDLALQDLELMGDIDAKYKNDYVARAELLQQLKKTDSAIVSWGLAIKSNPFDRRAYLGRARCRMVMNDYAGALEDLVAAERIKSDVEILHDKIKCFKNLKRFAEIIELTNNQSQTDVMLLKARVEADVALGLDDNALEDVTTLIAAVPKDTSAYKTRAEIYERLGKHGLSVKDLEVAKELEESSAR